MILKKLLYGAVAFAAAMGVASCQDDIAKPASAYEVPKATLQANTTIMEVKEKFWKNETPYCEEIPVKENGEHYIISGRVISADREGNVFKCLYLRDETAAIPISINTYNLWLTYRVGQEIVLDLTGMYIGRYAGLLQLGFPKWKDSANNFEPTFMAPEFFDEHRQLNGLPEPSKVEPLLIESIDMLNTNAALTNGEFLRQWQGQLVRINNVHFKNADGTATLCAEYHSSGENQPIVDANGSELNIRTSGYASFWNTVLPSGSGDVVGILGYYYSSASASPWQLVLIDVDCLMNFGNPTLPNGSEANPWSVDEGIEKINAGETPMGWTEGFIVGTVAPEVETVTSPDQIEWGATATLRNTVVIGATPDTRDLAACLIVPLPQGSRMREYVALADHPENLGKKLNVFGTLDKVMGVFGITGNNGSSTEFHLEGVDVPGDDPNPGVPSTGIPEGSGTEASPWNPSQMLAAGAPSAAVANTYVKGYIVGFIPDKSISEAKFELPATSATNILIATEPSGNTSSTVVPVQLPAGAIRSALNLQDNPDNFGKVVTLCGSFEKYFGTAGLKSVSTYKFEDGEGGGNTPTQPSGATLFSETFASGQGAFTIDNILLGSGMSYVWNFDERYSCMKASAFVGGSNHASEARLISPEIDLTGVTGAQLTYDQACKFFGSLDNCAKSAACEISADGGSTWTALTAPGLSEYDSWTFMSSGAIDLSAYVGKKVKLAFHYTSTDAIAGTWELKNVLVTSK